MALSAKSRWQGKVSQCHRVLGDLDADGGNHQGARTHYDQALEIVRRLTSRHVLIETLLARGRWAARYHPDLPELQKPSGLEQAFADLNEALDYATEGGYCIYEADIRVGLAWAPRATALRQAQGEGHQQAQDEALRLAQDEARRAQQMSIDMGYHWRQVDAAEILGALEA